MTANKRIRGRIKEGRRGWSADRLGKESDEHVVQLYMKAESWGKGL